jgi:hypothetical protein
VSPSEQNNQQRRGSESVLRRSKIDGEKGVESGERRCLGSARSQEITKRETDPD